MKIGIVGTGNIARSLTKVLTHKGYRVFVGGRDTQKARALAGEMDHFAEGGSITNALHYGEIVVLAVPYSAVPQVMGSVDAYRGKVIVDCTNALIWNDGMVNLAIGHTTSAAEQIAKMYPDARVVKAFNTSFFELIENGPYFGPHDASMFYCGDDEEAKDSVKRLIEAAGFEPVDCGPLDSARLLEPMAALMIRLGLGMEHGREIAFKLLKRG
ncbi:MAG: NADPH-dependent F420 reductase [Bacteroidota bacterium]